MIPTYEAPPLPLRAIQKLGRLLFWLALVFGLMVAIDMLFGNFVLACENSASIEEELVILRIAS